LKTETEPVGNEENSKARKEKGLNSFRSDKKGSPKGQHEKTSLGGEGPLLGPTPRKNDSYRRGRAWAGLGETSGGDKAAAENKKRVQKNRGSRGNFLLEKTQRGMLQF